MIWRKATSFFLFTLPLAAQLSLKTKPIPAKRSVSLSAAAIPQKIPLARPQPRLLPQPQWGAVGLLAGAGLGWRLAGPQATSSQRWQSSAVYGLTAGALTESLLALGRRQRPVHWSPRDTWLAGGIALVQTLDYLGTRDFRRAGYNEWLLSNSEVDRPVPLAATEAAVAAAGLGVMYLLNRSGHRRLAHWLAAAYIAVGLASYYNNEHYARTGQSWFH